MTDLEFDEQGMLARPDLHDALICRIDFGRPELTMCFQTSDGERISVLFSGVVHLFSSGLAEQNTVLDVSIETDAAVQASVLDRYLATEGSAQHAYRSELQRRLHRGEVKLFRVSPSYGGEFVVLAHSARY